MSATHVVRQHEDFYLGWNWIVEGQGVYVRFVRDGKDVGGFDLPFKRKGWKLRDYADHFHAKVTAMFDEGQGRSL